jgi:hypothetical protein
MIETIRMMWLMVSIAAIASTPYQQGETTVGDVLQAHNARDVDGDELGLAIQSASDGWTYSLNDGLSWLPLAESYQSNALLLTASTKLRADMSHPVEWIKVRAWDRSQGTEGTVQPITIVGGESAFSENLALSMFHMGAAAEQVDEGKRRPVTWKALSLNGNNASLTNVTYTIEPPEMAVWENRVATDPAAIAGYVKSLGPIGVFTLTIRGENKQGQVITSNPVLIEVVVGPAVSIEVTLLPQVD